MDGSYDEDLSENPFFMEFRNEHPEIFQHCISERWTICVPRVGSLTGHFFILQDFLGHILAHNEELPETHYCTLTEKPVKVSNKVISLDNEGILFQCNILFEETFYTEDFNKYRVWCVESMLEPTIQKDGRMQGMCQSVSSVRECIDLIWTESAGQDVLENVEVLVKEFLLRNKLEKASLAKQKDLISALYTNCLQKAFRNRRLREKCLKCKHLMQNLKLSIETFLQHLVYRRVMSGVQVHTAYDDADFNKMIRNLSDIQLRDLDVRRDLYDRVPKAKKFLANIQNCSTILEKVVSIKNAINAITNKDANASKYLLTADDLLPVLVFLVIKCGLPNWMAQITYMKEFRYSSSSAIDADETSFLITTLEAVIEYIKSGVLSDCPYPESHYYNDDSVLDDTSLRQASFQSLADPADTIAHLFEAIRLSNYNEVKAILTDVRQRSEPDLGFSSSLSLDEVLRDDDEVPIELCHPLCDCKKCNRIASRTILKTTPTVESRDGHGFAPLHVAAVNGKTQIIELLIAMNADVDVADYNRYAPLHYAALRGHQNALLLLLHANSAINPVNNDGNTPLHLAANNGHDSCVKALVYFCEQSKNFLEIDKKNESGNTALHLASKWGYESIVRLLIDYGAEPAATNAKGKTPFDYANNLIILRVLRAKQPNLQDYVVLNCNTDGNGNNVEEVRASVVADVEKTTIINEVILNCNDPVRPRTTDEIRSVERLIRAIVYGDTKLACFYMNVKYAEDKKTIASSKAALCHPLCACADCADYAPHVHRLNVNMCNSDGYTPLHMAVKYDRLELCEILLKNGAIPNLKNKNSQTPMHLAAKHARYAISELLISFKANVNIADIMGNTPLHIACTVGCISVVRLLLSNGASTSFVNTHGKTALDEAKEKIFLTIIGMIERHDND